MSKKKKIADCVKRKFTAIDERASWGREKVFLVSKILRSIFDLQIKATSLKTTKTNRKNSKNNS